jgi:hypothetical protein
MVTMVPGKVVRSRKPVLPVDNVLDPGRWLFRLTVVDDDRTESAPSDLIVTVQRRGRQPVRPVDPLVPVRPVRPRPPRPPRPPG